MNRDQTVLISGNISQDKANQEMANFVFKASHTWSTRAGAVSENTWHENVKVHRNGPKGEFTTIGVGPIEVFAHTIHGGMDNFHYTIHDVVSTGNLQEGTVAWRWEASGVFNHELLGVAPTKQAIKVPGASFGRIKGGKFVEAWLNMDLTSFPNLLPAISALAELQMQ